MISYNKENTVLMEDLSYEINILGVPIEHFPILFGFLIIGATLGPITMLIGFIAMILVSRKIFKLKVEGKPLALLGGFSSLYRIGQRYGLQRDVIFQIEVDK